MEIIAKIDEIIKKLNICTDRITTNNEVTLFITKPTDLQQLPSIHPSAINSKYMTIETPETILEYFKVIIENGTDNGYLNIQLVGGVHLLHSWYQCDYCRYNIRDDMYYCHQCNKDMCKMCYSKTDELINACRPFTEPKNVYNIIEPNDRRTCDMCEKYIGLHNKFYSMITEFDTYDICIDCHQTNNDAKNAVDAKNMRLIDPNDPLNYHFGHSKFKSMLNWFPLFKS